jgi:cobalt-zinc-cadmium efflux system protein
MTRDLLTKSIKDLMEATPAHINVDKLCHKLRAIKGVTGVHDLHVWCISYDKILMTAHIYVQQESDRAMINAQADTIAQKAGITHCTVQICLEEAVSSP